MQAVLHRSKRVFVVFAAAALTALAGCAQMRGMMHGDRLTLSGAQEVPPVRTGASGSGTITIGDDRSVSGSVTTTGVTATAAHIHEGAPGVNGPVIVPLVQTAANVWSVPAGARLTESQYRAYTAGNTYVNVHSNANKGGEIRAQLKP